MDKIKAAGFVGKMTTSAATFYNPYEKKQNETTGKNIITLVAQGEERTIAVQVGNNLSVPLIIPSCQLAFKKTIGIDIEAPSLSFTIPPKTENFCVNFPFIVVSAMFLLAFTYSFLMLGNRSSGDEPACPDYWTCFVYTLNGFFFGMDDFSETPLVDILFGVLAVVIL